MTSVVGIVVVEVVELTVVDVSVVVVVVDAGIVVVLVDVTVEVDVIGTVVVVEVIPVSVVETVEVSVTVTVVEDVEEEDVVVPSTVTLAGDEIEYPPTESFTLSANDQLPLVLSGPAMIEGVSKVLQLKRPPRTE